MNHKFRQRGKIKKVLLLNPPVTFRKGEASSRRIGVPIPLGIAYIASFLRQKGYSVELVDCLAEGFESPTDMGDNIRYGLSDRAIADIIEGFRPDAVLVSSMFSFLNSDMENVCSISKCIFPDVTVIVGGVHPSALPEHVLRKNIIDFAVLGEGEGTIDVLLDALNADASVGNIDGIAFRENGKVVINPKTSFVADIDVLPMPAYDLLPMKIYAKIFAPHNDVRQRPYASVVTSRGCPWKCRFCAGKVVWGNNIRLRSASKVVEEIELLVNKYGIREIHFEDDNLTLNKNFVEILDKLIERKLGITLHAPDGLGVTTLNRSLLEKMKEAGFFTFILAIESGNKRVLNKLMKKPLMPDKVREIVAIGHDIGLNMWGFFMLGMPGETKEEMKQTIEFIKELRLGWAAINAVAPHPGSEIYNECVKKGYIEETCFRSVNLQESIINTDEFTGEYVRQLSRNASREINFYHNSNLERGNFDQAIHDFKRIAELYPEFGLANFSLGRAYLKKGDFDEARRNFERSIELGWEVDESRKYITKIEEKNMREATNNNDISRSST